MLIILSHKHEMKILQGIMPVREDLEEELNLSCQYMKKRISPPGWTSGEGGLIMEWDEAVVGCK